MCVMRRAGLDWVHVREDEDWDLHWCNVGWVKEVCPDDVIAIHTATCCLID